MRRDEHKNRARWNQDNQGFSLLELLISIVILVLIMVPLMNNFFNSLRINNTAEEFQDNSNIAANIIEGMKPLNMQETLEQLMDRSKFKILTDSSGAPNAKGVMRLLKNGDGTYSKTEATEVQLTNYFGINGITENDILYDALVTVDASKYVYDETVHAGTKMNDYEMPDIAQVDENVNGMFVFDMYMDNTTNELSIKDNTPSSPDDSLDQRALDYFVAAANSYEEDKYLRSTDYAEYLRKMDSYQRKYSEALINGTTLPLQPTAPTRSFPEDCNIDYLRNRITKSAEIIIDKAAVSGVSVVTYRMSYECDWDSVDLKNNLNASVSYDISYKQYSTLLNNIYLYYNPSIFQQSAILNGHPDEIHISNNSGNAINCYIVKQDKAIDIGPEIIIFQTGTNLTNVYTNMTDSKVSEDGVAEELETSKKEKITKTIKKHRIYSITIQICRHVEGTTESRYQEILYTLESNREE